jgi:hypothetical protein
MLFAASAALALGAALALTGCDQAGPVIGQVRDLIDPGRAKVDAVVARTKALRSTYAVYNWTRVATRDGPTVEGPSAEYNAGPHHRVETMTANVVSDCDTGKTVTRLANGQESEDDAMSSVACGISTGVPFERAEYLGRVNTPYGKADRIRVVTRGLFRTYDIDKDGVILWSRFNLDTPDGKPVIETLGVVLRKDLPAGPEMFGRATLQKSFIPDDVIADLKRQAASRAAPAEKHP